MPFTDIRYTVAADVATVVIDRPKVLNAFTPHTLSELNEAFAQASDDKNVGVIVLTGSGERAFCAGGDVNWEKSAEFAQHEYQFHQTLVRCPKPVIARVNGYAIGGGNHMAYYCDLTVACEEAVFGQNGPRVGSPAAGGTVAHLANIVGHKRAKEMWLTCRRYSAQQMLAWGLVNAVVPRAKLDEQVRAWCDDMLALSPTCLRILKETFRCQLEPILALRQDELVRELAPDYFSSGEQQEGAKAFLEKRPPRFRKFR